MAKLNQIIAIEKGIKSRTYSEATNLHKASQKADLFNGMSRTYKPVNAEDQEKLPDEHKKVTFRHQDVLRDIARLMSEHMAITARKDWTNCNARASVKVEDKVLLADVPVTYLLFLEKQLTDMRTIIDKMPVLDESEDWKYDNNSSLYRTEPVQQHRTRKDQVPIVLYDATPEHPAQTQMITKDVIAGFWSTVKYSGAMPRDKKQQMAERVEVLLNAVKQAREEANSIDEVTAPEVGSAVFRFINGLEE